MRRQKVPITERALIQRINRKLKPDLEMLRVTRERWQTELGRFHIIDFDKNWICRKDVDLEELGRDLGVLADYEALVEP
jgi:hypothetical protein